MTSIKHVIPRSAVASHCGLHGNHSSVCRPLTTGSLRGTHRRPLARRRLSSPSPSPPPSIPSQSWSCPAPHHMRGPCVATHHNQCRCNSSCVGTAFLITFRTQGEEDLLHVGGVAMSSTVLGLATAHLQCPHIYFIHTHTRTFSSLTPTILKHSDLIYNIYYFKWDHSKHPIFIITIYTDILIAQCFLARNKHMIMVAHVVKLVQPSVTRVTNNLA